MFDDGPQSQWYGSRILVGGCIGDGGFAKVYQAHHIFSSEFCCIEDEGGEEILQNPNKKSKVSVDRALKVQDRKVDKLGMRWEFYITIQLIERLNDLYKTNTWSSHLEEFYSFNYLENRICNVYTLREYRDKSFLLEELCSHGTLLNLINIQKNTKNNVNEIAVAFYALEVLFIILGLHSCGIIHGDIKPDNFLVLNDGDSNELEDWSPTGARGWTKRGLKLIDFGTCFGLEFIFIGS